MLGDTSATEMDATNAKGWYLFDLTQAETNADSLLFTGKSATANVSLVGVWIQTVPAAFGLVAGAAGGLFIAGTNAATVVTTSFTTTFTGSLTGSVASVSGAVGSVTGAVGSVTGLTASDVGAIKTKTDFLPSATAGAAGGVFIAGTNAATTITTALTTTFTGNLTGSVGSVTGAVGSVTGLTASNLDATISSRMATYTQPTGFLAATFPGTVASTTNITAGTITTVTNLTNAPTAGDFTATMKTSIGTAVAASAVASVTAPVSITGDLSATMKTSVTTAATAATPSVTVSDKTGFRLDATGSAALTEGYAADGAAATLPQLLYLTLAMLTEFSITGTTLTAKKLDGSTTAGTFTLSDATNPTSITRAT